MTRDEVKRLVIAELGTQLADDALDKSVDLAYRLYLHGVEEGKVVGRAIGREEFRVDLRQLLGIV